ncbi:Phytosulfokines 2 [Rhynchospora pubera]|uniref:Phytosulfokine n=1 Tax=Rhynchospora pubera TaxID=906938 RepID=A0AAV8FX98_9POAL|nr:Phytosulfokines 2 [Rhynchospora pubera]KAJ4795468.1 Phytosulfokines 2 [Rhynchospora pubera]KAJ4819300.1 Phytosulfokines 2 [Rhynchospora pubera]
MRYRGSLCLLFIILISFHSVSGARLLISTEQAGVFGIHKADHVLSKTGGTEGNTEDNPWKLMGMEECKKGDEECEKRRLLSEAHLDYIYTQGHHKP